jgi:hypothetical protein
VALRLIYQMFSNLLGWVVLRARCESSKEIEILVLRHQLAVLQRRTATNELDRPRPDRRAHPTAPGPPTPRAAGHAGHGPRVLVAWFEVSRNQI